MEFGRIRLIAAIAGGVNVCLLVFVFGAPFWRTTMVTGGANALNNVYGYEGLWMECMNFYRRETQCYQIGNVANRQVAGQRYSPSSYYQYGIYAKLDAYRAFMMVALLAGIGGFCFSLAGMECTKALREGSKVKRWMNIIAGICYFLAGIMTGIAVSWYAAEVVREYWSPFYQATRIKYTLGVCLFIGWISMALSIALGCVLTCCTCFNNPVDEKEYEWKPPISEIEIPPEPVEAVMMSQGVGSRYDDDDWDEDDRDSRYTSSKKSHRSHKSYRSHRSHRSHKSHRSGSRSASAWVDDHDADPPEYKGYNPTYEVGFV